MVRRILVPTDGSGQSVKALDIAQQLAQAQGAEILLARVIEFPKWALYADESLGAPSPNLGAYDQIMGSLAEDARDSLARLASELQSRSVVVRTTMLEGSAAAELLDVETAEQVDLVVMATHGRTGVARFALGSVADRIIREGTSPVLLVRRSTANAAKLERVLVALDGSGVAEEALPLVRDLAGRPFTSVLLFRAVRDAHNHAPALRYLDAVAGELAQSGIRVETHVAHGEARGAIGEAARSVDLVVLCTHGRGGFDRLRHGSVAESLIRDLDRPILLTHTAAENQ